MRDIIPKLLQFDALSPSKLVRSLEKDPTLLPLLWPVLTEGIHRAEEKMRAEGKIPVWLSRVMDVCIYYSNYLKEAVKRGLIAEEELKKEKLKVIISAKLKSAAKQKAELLLQLLEN